MGASRGARTDTLFVTVVFRSSSPFRTRGESIWSRIRGADSLSLSRRNTVATVCAATVASLQKTDDK